MEREQVYNDEICCEVARVYCRRSSKSEYKQLSSDGWAWGHAGPHNRELSRKQCDALIEMCGGVKEAYDEAYDYLAGGCGIAG